MVFVSIPNKLSEQEQELQRKFAQLRKIKKQLAQLKAANSRPPDAETEKKNLKRTTSEAAGAATEQAKKLLKSGAIKVDTTKQAKQFKRARIDRGSTSKDNLDRQTSLAGYKPYSGQDAASGDEGEGRRMSRPNLKDNFIPASFRDSGAPRRGPRIYVRGEGITEEMLRENFSAVGGAILQVTMEPNKRSGFITFDTVESADEAVSRFHDTMVNGIRLEVEIARRQYNSHQHRLNFDKNNPKVVDPKPLPTDRNMVTYDDDNIFD